MDWLQKNEETKQTVGKIAAGLEEFTKQLNAFKPASVASVGDAQKQFSEQFNECLLLQSNRMDVLSASVEKQQKTAEDNAELSQNFLIGIENLGDNMKHIQKEIEIWRTLEFQEPEAEYAEMNEQF